MSVFVRSSVRSCAELPAAALSNSALWTDDSGTFRVIMHFPIRSGEAATPVLVCVARNLHEPYGALILYDNVRGDPRRGKYLNVSLRPIERNDVP